MFDKLIAYLSWKGWRYSVVIEQSAVSLSLSGINGVFYCYAKDEPNLNRFSFLTWCIGTCPADLIIGMAELLMRLNSTIFYGSFDLDFETGSIAFKTSIFYENLELNNVALDNIVINNISIMDNCTPIVLKYIYAGLSPIDAVNIRRESLEMPLLESPKPKNAPMLE